MTDRTSEEALAREVELVEAEEERWAAMCHTVGLAFYDSEWLAGRDEAVRESAIRDFVHFVATEAAYNGAPDRGQWLYDDGLNPWLSGQADRYIRSGIDQNAED
jgi:hypothetical protein